MVYRFFSITYKTQVFNHGSFANKGCSNSYSFVIPIFVMMCSDLTFTLGAMEYIFSIINTLNA